MQNHHMKEYIAISISSSLVLHLIILVHRHQAVLDSKPEEIALFPISHDAPYFCRDKPQIMGCLWQNPPIHPTIHDRPSESPYSIASAHTQLEFESARHRVETNPFGLGLLSFGSPPSYLYPFENAGHSLGTPSAGPLPLEIPPLGALPVTPPLTADTWMDFAKTHVAHPTVHHSTIGAFNAKNDRHRPTRDASHPYLPPYSRTSRKRVPGVHYEPDIHKLQERCIRQGGEYGAIALIPQIFARGVHKEALVRLRTGEEVAFGEDPGPVYLCFLQAVEESSTGKEDQTCVTRYTCRLCPGSSDTKFSWKNERDVLRHLRKQHFGLSDSCDLWSVSRPSLSNFPLTYSTQRETRLHNRGDEKPSLYKVEGPLPLKTWVYTLIGNQIGRKLVSNFVRLSRRPIYWIGASKGGYSCM